MAAPLVSVAVIALLAASVMSTLSQYTASITNTNNSVESGTLGLVENGICAAPGDGQWHECATVNKLGGGTLSSGTSTTATVTLQNTGTLPAALYLLPSRCSDSLTGAGGTLCDEVTVQVVCDSVTIVSTRTLNAFHAQRNFPTGYAAGTLDAGDTVTCTFTVVAGLISAPGTVSQPISWRLIAS
jgi:hypothetical protein